MNRCKHKRYICIGELIDRCKSIGYNGVDGKTSLINGEEVNTLRINERKLRHLLIDRDIGQKELAVRAGLSRGAVNNVCCGRSCASDTAFKIAQALGVPLEDLIEEEVTTK